MSKGIKLLDFQPITNGWHKEVVSGLGKPVKELPAKLFYDQQGSQLFEQICTLPEYYPTRTEQSIMEDAIDEMADQFGPNCLLIEYGSGSSQKTRTLLDHLLEPAGYIPIDISRDHLLQSAKAIIQRYPNLEVLPVCADYDEPFEIPNPMKPVLRRLIYYPGSTIGNYHPNQAVAFLGRMRAICGEDCHMLIGVDLKKDHQTLHDAYNDRAGVTAAFNLNMLARLNRDLGANFCLEQFQHRAFYNEKAGRIEMHLISLRQQTVNLNGNRFHFCPGETIWTESSYKYSLAEFARLVTQVGLKVQQVWTDKNCLFSVQYLVPA